MNCGRKSVSERPARAAKPDRALGSTEGKDKTPESA
jgi:hypothetical protein